MNRSYRILPVYTGDVSGVASALYELGGMVVMHDPSGCNSTYNTHDENRWYDHESLIYISGLTDTDAVLGNDEKLITDICDAAAQLKPKFIAIAGSPIGYLNGTDFPAVARLVEKRSGIPAFSVATNGMHDYAFGAGRALEAAAVRLLPEMEARDGNFSGATDRRGNPVGKTGNDSEAADKNGKILVNILGATPLDFWGQNTIDEIKNWIESQDMAVGVCLAMGEEVEGQELFNRLPLADVNLVVSVVGLRTAKLLHNRYGTPYVQGLPVGAFAPVLADRLRKAVSGLQAAARNQAADNSPSSSGQYILGEPITMGSIAMALNLEYGTGYQVLCPLESEDAGVAGVVYRHLEGEEEMEEALKKDASEVIGDPLYRLICGPEITFHDLPHLAFSGRCYRKTMRDLMAPDLIASFR